jgi:hypothetical protein
MAAAAVRDPAYRASRRLTDQVADGIAMRVGSKSSAVVHALPAPAPATVEGRTRP